ncbi:MAG: hypothetical protein IJ973_03950 [Christensenellaceae bacterium]|nr:hypothetical protein [Christensenellaceae bacterium]
MNEKELTIRMDNPMIVDVKEEYITWRRLGKTREETVSLMREQYDAELQDIDERIEILVGLSLALCKKKELYESIAEETLQEITKLRNMNYERPDINLKKIEQRLQDKDLYGDEAVYRRSSRYVPDWKVGDLFSHELTYPTSEKLGIKGWMILLYKVGEYVDRYEDHSQLMYVFLCPPDKIPSCREELEKLGFLRMMLQGEKSEYLAQITIKSKKAEETYGLTKIGYFPDVNNLKLPDDRVLKENPLVCRVLCGKFRKDDLWPSYEDTICRVYQWYENKRDI